MSAKDKKKGALMPRLRFSEFRDAGEWAKILLSKIAAPVSERATDGDVDDVLTLSAEHGVVAQGTYFGKKVAGDDVRRYIRIMNNDFVYNDRTTKLYKYGTIKRLSRHAFGIVSPIYKCFRFNHEEIPMFWEWYFESGEHDAQLHSIINEGAKEGRFNISIQQFLSTHVYFPNKTEQQKIADCLSSLDEHISAEANKLDALKSHKHGLLKQFFPAEGETLPALRFPEFRRAKEWEAKYVGDIFQVTRGEVLAMPLVSQQRTIKNAYPVYSSQTKNNGLCGFYNSYIYENAITWTTDGANAGDVRYREGKFFCTNVCGVLINTSGYANGCLAEIINSVAKSHVSYVGNPKLMNGVMSKIKIFIPAVAEQQRIADCLSSLDELITAQTQKIDLLKSHKKGLMQQLFPEIDEAKA